MTDNQRKWCDMIRDIYSLKLTIENMQGELDYQRDVARKFASDKLGGNEYYQASEFCRKQGWIRTP